MFGEIARRNEPVVDLRITSLASTPLSGRRYRQIREQEAEALEVDRARQNIIANRGFFAGETVTREMKIFGAVAEMGDNVGARSRRAEMGVEMMLDAHVAGAMRRIHDANR